MLAAEIVTYLVHLLNMLLCEVRRDCHPALRHGGDALNRGHGLVWILNIWELKSARYCPSLFRPNLAQPNVV